MILKHAEKSGFLGKTLAVQWLRLHVPMQGAWVQSLIRELDIVAVKREKKRNEFVFFFPVPFLRTKTIKRMVSRPEHS